VHSIAEQRQIFKGADHAFLWKPKLRIPDIYENRANQLALRPFPRYLPVLQRGKRLNPGSKGTRCPGDQGTGAGLCQSAVFPASDDCAPFNTAIVKGYNSLTGAKVKLGRWTEYLAMREGILTLNGQYRYRLSNDLGAITGLLFDIGSGRYAVAHADDSGIQWEDDLARVREESAAAAVARNCAGKRPYAYRNPGVAARLGQGDGL
jgi:type II restriction enzyme